MIQNEHREARPSAILDFRVATITFGVLCYPKFRGESKSKTTKIRDVLYNCMSLSDRHRWRQEPKFTLRNCGSSQPLGRPGEVKEKSPNRGVGSLGNMETAS